MIIRFGHDGDDTCMQMDETLASVADKMKNFAVIYLVDITEVPDFNAMYELYDPCTVMFFSEIGYVALDVLLRPVVSPPHKRKVITFAPTPCREFLPTRRTIAMRAVTLRHQPAGPCRRFFRTARADRAVLSGSARRAVRAFVCPGRTPHPRHTSHASPAPSAYHGGPRHGR